MKKISKLLFAMMMVVMCVLLTSCFTEEDETKFKQMMDIPGNDNYYFIFTYGITKNKTNYYFSDLAIQALIEKGIDKKVISSTPITSGAKVGNKYFLQTRYTNKAENNKSIIGYIELDTCKYHPIKLVDQDNLSAGCFGDSFVYHIGDKIEIYDQSLNKREISANGNKWEITKNWLIEHDFKNEKINVYNKDLHKYVIDNQSYEFILQSSDEYIIFKGAQYFGVYCKRNEQMSTEDVDAIVKNNNSNRLVAAEEELRIYIEPNQYETLITMEELRSTSPEIVKVEEIFNSTLKFRRVFYDNNEIYITIGNSDSFFGAYQRGCTYQMVYKVTLETKTVEYLGCYGQVHAELTNVVIMN